MTARFFTNDGLEVPAVTAAQMREVDRIAIEETGPNLFQMMENAGRSLALEVLDRLGQAQPGGRVVVLAGRGGNGGGGICAARHLVNRGVDVRLCLAEPDRMSEVSAFQRSVYVNAGGREIAAGELSAMRPSVVVDAVFGYSLRGTPRGPAAALIAWANDLAVPVLALDVPSGIDATTGEASGEFVQASWTLTLALPKTGLSADRCGALTLADLGIPASVFHRIGLQYRSPFGPRFRIALRIA